MHLFITFHALQSRNINIAKPLNAKLACSYYITSITLPKEEWMKKYRCQALACLIIVFLSGHAVTGQSLSPQDELVAQFLSISRLKYLDKPARKAMISPRFLASLGDKKEIANVNMYVPDSFHIEKDSGQYVSAIIWGLYKSWVHRLVFKVEQIDNQHYIVPSADARLSEQNLFDPWIRVDKKIDNSYVPVKK